MNFLQIYVHSYYIILLIFQKNKSTQLPSTSSNLPFYHKTCYPVFKKDAQQYKHTGPNKKYYAHRDFIRMKDKEIEDDSYEEDESDNINDENHLMDDKNNDADDDDENYEVDEDFRKFLESTMRHKEELSE